MCMDTKWGIQTSSKHYTTSSQRGGRNDQDNKNDLKNYKYWCYIELSTHITSWELHNCPINKVLKMRGDRQAKLSNRNTLCINITIYRITYRIMYRIVRYIDKQTIGM